MSAAEEISITPSALECVDMCPIKYALKYWIKLTGDEQPLEPGKPDRREVGNTVHRYFELWGRFGAMPDATAPHFDLFNAMLAHAPQNRQGDNERWQNLELGALRLGAKADWTGVVGQLPNYPFSDTNAIAASDYKTSSQPQKYGIWGQLGFLNDHQAIIVGLAIARKRQASVIAYRWIYGNTRGKAKAESSDAVVSRDQLEYALTAKVKPSAERIYLVRTNIRTAQEALALARPSYEKQNEICFAYNTPCEYYEYCYKGKDPNMALPTQTPFGQPQQQMVVAQPQQQAVAAPPPNPYAVQPQGAIQAQLAMGQAPAPVYAPAVVHQPQFVGTNPPEVQHQQQVVYAPAQAQQTVAQAAPAVAYAAAVLEQKLSDAEIVYIVRALFPHI